MKSDFNYIKSTLVLKIKDLVTWIIILTFWDFDKFVEFLNYVNFVFLNLDKFNFKVLF